VDSCLFEYNDGNTSACISIHNTNHQLDLQITNTVFQFNKARYSCAGIYIGNGSYAKPVVENCIFYHNEAGGTNQMASNFGNDYVDYTLIDVENCDSLKDGLHPMYDTLTCGPNMLFNIDPLFRDTAAGDFRLRGCSPLINQGDSTWAARFGLLTDLGGNSRWQDGIPDIGAYETAKTNPLSQSSNRLGSYSTTGSRKRYPFRSS